jgi:hypothetical protein
MSNQMLILFASFGARTRFCLVPRCRSVVWMDAWPNSNWILLEFPAGSAAQSRAGLGRYSRDLDPGRVTLKRLPDDLHAEALAR